MYRLSNWIKLQEERRESSRVIMEYLMNRYSIFQIITGKWRKLPAYPELHKSRHNKYARVLVIPSIKINK